MITMTTIVPMPMNTGFPLISFVVKTPSTAPPGPRQTNLLNWRCGLTESGSGAAVAAPADQHRRHQADDGHRGNDDRHDRRYPVLFPGHRGQEDDDRAD